MSYDLIVFEPDAAPRDRMEFLDWIKDAAREDGGARSGPPSASPALWAWRNDMFEAFPASDGPRAFDPYSTLATRNATYRLVRHAIIAGFHWEASGAALFQVKKLVQKHRLGFFDASGEARPVWMVSRRRRFEIVHSDVQLEVAG